VGHDSFICVAVCCSGLQRVAVSCRELQCARIIHLWDMAHSYGGGMIHSLSNDGVVVCCSVLQCVAECCRVLQHVAACCSVLQYVTFKLCSSNAE